jgi:hypothetical protein
LNRDNWSLEEVNITWDWSLRTLFVCVVTASFCVATASAGGIEAIAAGNGWELYFAGW